MFESANSLGVKIYRVEQKNPAKFGDTCSVRADGLCIGCLGQWAETGRDNSNMQEFFCTTLYMAHYRAATEVAQRVKSNPFKSSNL